tara:strand:+ start:38 stop:772 length:735 start_codon:yes stop_codon:yes gene_type:complete
LKRIFDLFFSIIGLLILLPLLLILIFLIWLQDYETPFYIAKRVGKDGKLFNMIKMRTMIINADKSGVDSTSVNDKRITPLGAFIRKFKLDEFPQLINVIKGEMSLVGPRPNVINETNLYTKKEQAILKVQPGITDIASIVFSDEGEILKESDDPDIDYNQLIRPRKSQLGIFYKENRSLLLDINLILITITAILNKKKAKNILIRVLRRHKATNAILEIVKREKPLIPIPPPGSNSIVTTRQIK